MQGVGNWFSQGEQKAMKQGEGEGVGRVFLRQIFAPFEPLGRIKSVITCSSVALVVAMRSSRLPQVDLV